MRLLKERSKSRKTKYTSSSSGGGSSSSVGLRQRTGSGTVPAQACKQRERQGEGGGGRRLLHLKSRRKTLNASHKPQLLPPPAVASAPSVSGRFWVSLVLKIEY